MEGKRTNDYSNGKNYAIYNYAEPSLIYVGSICQNLSKRLSKHRREINSTKSQTIHYTSECVSLVKNNFTLNCWKNTTAKAMNNEEQEKVTI